MANVMVMTGDAVGERNQVSLPISSSRNNPIWLLMKMNKNSVNANRLKVYRCEPGIAPFTMPFVKFIIHSKMFCFAPGRICKLRDNQNTSKNTKIAETNTPMSLVRLKFKPKSLIEGYCSFTEFTSLLKRRHIVCIIKPMMQDYGDFDNRWY